MPGQRQRLLLACLLVSCGDCAPHEFHFDPIVHGGGSSRNAPWRDQWREVHEGPFVHRDADGEPLITTLQIGSQAGYADNFLNRGDVVVRFDGEPDRIRIELRRFTFATDERSAAETFDRLQLWAYDAKTSTPGPPSTMDPDARCDGSDGDAPRPWRDGCAILVRYDGLAQLERAGADIRVTLPPDYRGKLAIETSDNDAESSYPNRGNVCVTDSQAQLDVRMHSGVAFVRMAAPQVAGTLNPYPDCPQSLVEGCIDFVDPQTQAPAPWDPACGCIAAGYEPAQVHVTATAPDAADITVDVPQGLWTRFAVENSGNNALGGPHCTAALEGIDAAAIDDELHDEAKPWLRRGALFVPGDAVGGAWVQLTSEGCAPVGAVESPHEWTDDADAVEPVPRGDLELCSGCLADVDCDALLPGG
ncbi:MAG: hypothetical protein K1X88_19935 [Nannocystaceae bacterium]|nr:hypothetical protein [Nannocystaceae bacterium]